MTTPVRYRVWFRNPHDHLVRIEVRFVAPGDGPLVHMPSWTPGSYLLREYGRHLQRMSVAVGGATRELTHEAKASWRLGVREGEEVTLSYSLYAHELTVRTPHVDGSHAFLLGAGVFVWIDGLESAPHEIDVEPPKAWRILTTLPVVADRPARFGAVDYDHLVDSVFELGAEHEVLELEVLGVPHRIAFWGRGNHDAERLAGDVARVVEENARRFDGELPYERYLFVVFLTEEGQGGLEHRDSCVLQWPRHRLRERDYDDFLRLVAHEHFHVWNVKRIRPERLGPFDYRHEAYTQALWAMEGITSYYDQRTLLTAGLIRPERYLELTAERIERLASVPGRRLRSLEQASFEAWHGLYKPTEQTPNASVSYYLLGALVTLVLDLEIRRATAGDASFDAVMKTLWSRYRAEPGRGLPDADFKEAVIEVGGASLRPLVEAYVEGTEELDWSRHLEAVGLTLDSSEAAQVPHFGVVKREEGERIVIASVLSDGPNAGLNLYPGDELVAVDRYRVTPSTWASVLKLLPLEGEVELALFRRGELVLSKGRVAPGRGRPRIVPLEEASPAQRRARREWLGAELTDTSSRERGTG